MIADNLIEQIVMQLLHRLPSLLVYLLGVILGFVFLISRRSPGASILAIVGFGLLLVESIVSTVLWVWLPSAIEDDMGTIYEVVGVLESVIYAGTMLLVVAAVFWGRGTSR